MPSTTRSRRRDRHGRGLRGPLLPRELPAYRTRRDRFDDRVLDAVERLGGRGAAELEEGGGASQPEDVEFAVEDIPPSDPAPWEHGEAPLGRFFPAQGELPARVVV